MRFSFFLASFDLRKKKNNLAGSLPLASPLLHVHTGPVCKWCCRFPPAAGLGGEKGEAAAAAPVSGVLRKPPLLCSSSQPNLGGLAGNRCELVFGPKTQLLGVRWVAAVLGFVTFAGRRVSKRWWRGELRVGALPAALPFSTGKSGVGTGSGLADVIDMDCSPSAIDDLMKEVSPEHGDGSEVKHPKILGAWRVFLWLCSFA